MDNHVKRDSIDNPIEGASMNNQVKGACMEAQDISDNQMKEATEKMTSVLSLSSAPTLKNVQGKLVEWKNILYQI